MTTTSAMSLRHFPGQLLAVIAMLMAVLLLAPTPGSAAAQRGTTKDIGGVPEEKEFKETDTALPAYPKDADLIEFQRRGSSQNRFYIDRNSVSIGTDRVVRYSAVVRSSSGAANISYEGMRCKTAQYKVYAYGVKENAWSKAREPQWRAIRNTSTDFRFTLYADYLCDLEAIAGNNAQDLVRNLKGNPLNSVTDKNR